MPPTLDTIDPKVQDGVIELFLYQINHTLENISVDAILKIKPIEVMDSLDFVNLIQEIEQKYGIILDSNIEATAFSEKVPLPECTLGASYQSPLSDLIIYVNNTLYPPDPK